MYDVKRQLYKLVLYLHNTKRNALIKCNWIRVLIVVIAESLYLPNEHSTGGGGDGNVWEENIINLPFESVPGEFK